MIFSMRNIISTLLIAGYGMVPSQQIEGDLIENYKSAIIQYCRAVEPKTMIWSKESIREAIQNVLNQLENMDSSVQVLETKGADSLEDKMIKAFETKYSEFVKIARNVIETYQSAILSAENQFTRTQKAFHYTSLKWLEFKMKLNEATKKMKSDYQSLKDLMKEFLSQVASWKYLPSKMIEDYTSAMILYSQVVPSKTMIWSKENVETIKRSLNELNNFNSSVKISEEYLENEDVDSLENKIKDVFETKYTKFMKMSINIMKTYQTAILTVQNQLTYTQKVFYYRALKWLEHKMKLDEPNEAMKSEHRLIEETIEEIRSTTVVENDEEINSSDDISQKLGTKSQDIILQFQLFRCYEDAIVKIAFHESFEIRTMNPYDYESILTEDSENIFETKFGSEPFRMLMYMDYGYSQKHKLKNLENIDINSANGAFEKWKYTLIFFFRKVDETFHPPYPNYESNNNLDSYHVFFENKTLLEHFLVRETVPSLRKQCYTFFYSMILPQLDDFIKKMNYNNHEITIKRLYYARLLSWLNYRLFEEPSQKWAEEKTWEPQIVIKTIVGKESIPVSKYVKDGLDREKKGNPMIKLFSLDITKNIRSINTISDLTRLGNDEEQVLNVFNIFARECSYRKNCYSSSTSIREHAEWKEIPRADKYEIKPEIYEDMLEKVNPQDFKATFRLEPYEMLLYMDYTYHFRTDFREFFKKYMEKLGNSKGAPTESHAHPENIRKVKTLTTLGHLGNSESVAFDSGTEFAKRMEKRQPKMLSSINKKQNPLEYWKYALVHFYRNYEILHLNDGKMDSKNVELLEYFSDKEDPRDMRSWCIAFLYVHILREIEEKIEKNCKLTEFVNSVYSLQTERIENIQNPDTTIKSTIVDILRKIRAESKPISDDKMNNIIKYTQLVIRSDIQERGLTAFYYYIKLIPSKIYNFMTSWGRE